MVFIAIVAWMALGLQLSLQNGNSDPEVRAIVISGNGKAFSSGQDLKEATSPDGPSLETIINEHYNPIIIALRESKKVVIAGVNGVAAGAGANIALACDIIVASRSASFIQAFSKIGLIPDSGGTFFLPRLIGFQRAAALMMTGDSITAEEAFNMGMIYKCYDDDQFISSLDKLALKIAQMPTKALEFTKKALQDSLYSNLEQQLSTELKYQQLSGETKDFKEGIKAFIEKRKPNFIGE